MSVAAAIVDGDRVLAIRRRDNDNWEPPGGTLEPSEPILEGLRREVLEETGITILQAELCGVYKNISRSIVALVFRAQGEGAVPQLTAEAAEIRWLSRSEISELLDPAYACRLLDALEEGPPRVRAHDGVRLLEDL